MMTDPAREQSITRFGLRPLPGASHVTDTQIEQARREARHRRSERIQTANDAVDAYLRESGTRNDPAAFRHIQRTRPELFAGTQVPMGPVAANFNPYHDKLGRFTTKDGASDGRNDGLDGQGGGRTKPASIRGHAYNSKDLQTCVAASIRSLIAAKHPDRVPSEDAVKAQLTAAAKGIFTKPKEDVEWSSTGVAATAGHYGALVQQVLANNGVPSAFQPGYATMQQLSHALIRSGQPAMINLQPEDGVGEHSVAVQWDPDAADGEGRFLINNVTTKGYTDSFTKAQFESGQITSDLRDQGSIQSPKPRRYRVDNHYAVVITE